jgi:hypothetical protein
MFVLVYEANTMIADYRKLAPYFRNGLLYVPEKTAQALREVGLDEETAQRVTSGLALDERKRLHELSEAIDVLLHQLDVDSPLFEALTSDESYFMLTGLPASA